MIIGDIIKNKNIVISIFIFLSVVLLIISTVCFLNIIFSKIYYDTDFNIETYTSTIDSDGDGIDDQTDILKNAQEYVAKNPKYKSKYYDTGYSNDEYGVCTDVVAIALLNSGYDLQQLVDQDIRENKELYNIDKIDKNIDFRRVRNLKIYFKHNSISLTTDINKIAEWHGGDIVIFEKHIGIVSNKRNKEGLPFIIHHANPYQIKYEEDVLKYYQNNIVGHYRIS